MKLLSHGKKKTPYLMCDPSSLLVSYPAPSEYNDEVSIQENLMTPSLIAMPMSSAVQVSVSAGRARKGPRTARGVHSVDLCQAGLRGPPAHRYCKCQGSGCPAFIF